MNDEVVVYGGGPKVQHVVNDLPVFIQGLRIPNYDYVGMALSGGNTIETYTFKTGGSGGTTVATVVIVYTDSTRSVLVSVTKT